MADLIKHKCFKNTEYEVLTKDGFSNFKGIFIGDAPDKIKFTFQSFDITCTPKHKFVDGASYKYAEDFCVGMSLQGHLILKIEHVRNDKPVYDFLEIEKNHKYVTINGLEHKNCLMIDEAAFIPAHIMDEFWSSVVPIISSSMNSKIILVSTSNGTSNKFYEIYSKAERGESEEWTAERIDWHEIPGRGKKWKANMIESLGSQEQFDQEFGNMFIETGESAISSDIIDRWRRTRKPPLVTLSDGHYRIWEAPIEGHVYVIGVDVSEGVGEAASVAQVLDITDLSRIKQVACYHDSLIDPHFFAEELYKIANHWGRPLMAIERNNAGGQVLDCLYHTHNYTNFLNVTSEGGAKDRLGIYSQSGVKYRGVSNMRYWVNTLDVLEINDLGLIQELETFIRRPNGMWKKKDGKHIRDDRVDAFFWALFVLDTENAEKHFEVLEYDDRGKPKKIKPFYVEAPQYYQLDKFYQSTPNAPTPLLFGFSPDDPNDVSMDDLMRSGWQMM